VTGGGGTDRLECEAEVGPLPATVGADAVDAHARHQEVDQRQRHRLRYGQTP
jgi:hypothetical protein